MTSSLFTPDFKAEPYWWEAVPRPVPASGAALPGKVDVLVVGSGYTGLAAALQTARAARTTLVVDAEDAGWGCSARNGGQIGGGIKSSYAELEASRGEAAARAIIAEGQAAMAWLGEFIAAEKIACAYQVCGRFHAAHTPRHCERLVRYIESQPKGLEYDAHAVPRAKMHEELGTDAYHGGVVYTHHASVDPARLHQGIYERALGAGVRIVSHCRVNGIARERDGFDVETARGRVRARDVVVATNGYTGALTPWQQRRVIPIGSYMIATEPLPREVMDRLMPRDRVVSDTRKVVYYYRSAPDRSRILFGGRVSHNETDPRLSGPKLHAVMTGLFPELARTRISHSWVGFVAYTFDTLPHVGRHEGIHYAMGYCGVGVAFAPYLGTRVGQQVLGLAEGATAFDGLTFQTRPFYTGNPWFLATAVRYYQLKDRMGL